MNLDTAIEIDLKGFFQWWGRELAFLVPKTLRRKLSERHGCVIFSSAEKGFDIAFFDDDDKLIVKRRMELSENGVYQKLKEQYPALEKADIVLRLPSQQALQRQIFLPSVAQENLQQVVSFELDRYTPFKPEQVYFTVLPLGSTGHGQIQALLIAVPKKQLDEQLALLASLGVRPHRVDYQAVVDAFPQTLHSYNLLPDRYRKRGNQWERWAHWLISTLVLAMALAVNCGVAAPF